MKNEGKEITTIHDHINLVYCVIFNTSGTLFATGSADSNVKVWNFKENEK